jgi:glutathione S-transferase
MSQCVPLSITVSGVQGDDDVNGAYTLNGLYPRLGANAKAQWMQPGTRRYIRFIRGRWELYTSHHPNGTTFFYSEEPVQIPPLDGWVPTIAVLPSDRPVIEFSDDLVPFPRPPPSDELGKAGEGEDSKAFLLPDGGTLVLYANRTCPFAQRVLVTLAELDLAAEVRHVDVLGDKDPSFVELFRAACPDKTRRPAIPLLVHRRGTVDSAAAAAAGAAPTISADVESPPVVLIESAVICAYLEEAFTTPALGRGGTAAAVEPAVVAEEEEEEEVELKAPPPSSRPTPFSSSSYTPLESTSPVERARIRLWIDLCGRVITPGLNACLGARDPSALFAAGAKLREGLEALDTWLCGHAAHHPEKNDTEEDNSSSSSSSSGGGGGDNAGSNGTSNDGGGGDDGGGGGGGGAFVCGGGCFFTQAEAQVGPDLQRLVSLLPRFRPGVAPVLGLSETAEGANVVEFLRRNLPRLHAWCVATLARPSVAKTFHEKEVAAIKARAVATFLEDSTAQAKPSAENASGGFTGNKAALGRSLLLRPPRAGPGSTGM